MIGQQKFRKFRIITITNWDCFQAEQSPEPKAEQQTDSKRTTGGQHADTYKNDKNDNKHKGRDYLSSKQKEIQRTDTNFEKAKAEFLRRIEQQEKESANILSD